MFDALQFFRDLSIETAPKNHKHYQKDWINVECPFCNGDFGYHLGFSLLADIFNCWRCGRHTKTEVVKHLAEVPWATARVILTKYSTKCRPKYNATSTRNLTLEVKFPIGIHTLDELPRHREYLKSRRYGHRSVQENWGIVGTNHLGNYRQRIIVPIHYDGRMVSYQGRDVTGLQQERYKACARAQEAVPHKELLYGMDYLTQNRIIVCEGILDVWRMGPGAVCTFGVGYTQRQFLLLCEFPRVVLLYDMDTHGRQAAKVLGYNLETMGSEVWIPEYDAPDPDSLTPRDASLLKEDIEKWYDRKEGSVTVARN